MGTYNEYLDLAKTAGIISYDDAYDEDAWGDAAVVNDKLGYIDSSGNWSEWSEASAWDQFWMSTEDEYGGYEDWVTQQRIPDTAAGVQSDIEGFIIDVEGIDTIVYASDGNPYYASDLDANGIPLPGASPITDIASILADAEALSDVQTFEEWRIANPDTAYLDLNAAWDAYSLWLTDNPRDAELEEAHAMDISAQLLGYDSWDDYQAKIEMYDTQEFNPTGFSAQQSQLRERAINREAANMQKRAQGLVDQVMSQGGGSASRSFAAADALINEIGDYVLKATYENMQDELAYEMGQIDSAVQARAGLQSQYGINYQAELESIENRYLAAEQNYLTASDAAVRVNAQAYAEYSGEVNAASTASYNGLMVRLAVSQSAINSAWAGIDNTLKEIMAQFGMTMDQWGVAVDTETLLLGLQQYMDSDDFTGTDALTLGVELYDVLKPETQTPDTAAI